MRLRRCLTAAFCICGIFNYRLFLPPHRKTSVDQPPALSKRVKSRPNGRRSLRGNGVSWRDSAFCVLHSCSDIVEDDKRRCRRSARRARALPPVHFSTAVSQHKKIMCYCSCKRTIEAKITPPAFLLLLSLLMPLRAFSRMS